MTTDLTTAAREAHQLRGALAAHVETATAEEKRLREEIRKRETILSMAEGGVDADKVTVARTVVYATDYSRGGEDRNSVRQDAIKQFATGEPVRKYYGDLWKFFFGTKNYDRWVGQRSDCEYGYGPKHGSTCFEIGITKETREREQTDLTPDEIEAVIYFLVNLDRIQTAEKQASESANAA